jgi:hypothetical protein
MITFSLKWGLESSPVKVPYMSGKFPAWECSCLTNCKLGKVNVRVWGNSCLGKFVCKKHAWEWQCLSKCMSVNVHAWQSACMGKVVPVKVHPCASLRLGKFVPGRKFKETWENSPRGKITHTHTKNIWICPVSRATVSSTPPLCMIARVSICNKKVFHSRRVTRTRTDEIIIMRHLLVRTPVMVNFHKSQCGSTGMVLPSKSLAMHDTIINLSDMSNYVRLWV